MSYLLKALQKAEQERQQTIQAEHDEPVMIQPKSSLPMGLVLVIVLLLIVTLWQVWPNKVDDYDHAVAEGARLEAPKSLLTSTPKNFDTTGLSSSEAENVQKSAIEPQPTTVVDKPKDLSQLTAQELARIPSLNLASHIYSSAAEFRSVVINDQTYKEGALIRAGLILEEINQSGIVINIHGQRVELPKGISWVASQDAK